MRIIEQRKKVSLGLIWKWVQQYGSNCQTPLEIADNLKLKENNHWGNILVLDGKVVKGVRQEKKGQGHNWTLLIAKDFKTHDVISHRLANSETTDDYNALIEDVQKCGYSIKAVVSDDNQAIESLFDLKQIRKPVKTTRRYPRPGLFGKNKKLPRVEKGILYGVPHQICTIHFRRNLQRILKPRESRDIFNQLLYSGILRILSASTCFKAKKELRTIFFCFTKGYYQSKNQIRAISLLLASFKKLTLHLRAKEGREKAFQGKRVAIPKTSNSIENGISYLEARLKTMKRFKSKKSALNTLNLIMVNFRFKPLKGAKNKRIRGRSPLDLATGKKLNSDWLKFSQKSTA